MSSKDLFAVSVAAIAVWFVSMGFVLLLGALGFFAYFLVGIALLFFAGFLGRSGRTPGS